MLPEQDDVAALVESAGRAGVGALIYSAASVEEMADVLATVEKFDNVFGTLGVQPEHANEKNVISDLIGNLSHTKILGVGEIGLDYHYNSENKPAQRDLFVQQLEIAKTANLPVAIHSRDAEEDTFEIMKNYDLRGVMHCFTGTWDFAKKMLDRGFYISASGIITFKNADAVRETFSKIPLDRIVVETDAPYCAPVPYRGKTCQPAHVVETAKCVAGLRGVTFKEMEKILFENTIALYPKMRLGDGA